MTFSCSIFNDLVGKSAMYKNLKKFITVALVTSFALISMTSIAYASGCEPYYNGGETCVINKRFSIDKDVRIEGDNEWKDKVTGVEASDVVEFRITVQNLSDEEADAFDNMKMEDFLPDEFNLLDNEGLTEYWNDFGSGEEKKFTIKVQVKPEEFNREDQFEKCIVNKAEVEWDGEFEGSDTATVCYGNVEVTELPETGFGSAFAMLGTAFTSLGVFLKKKISK